MMKLAILVAFLALVSAHQEYLEADNAITFDKATSYRYVYYAYASYNTPVGWTCPYCTNYTKGFTNYAQCSNKTHGSFAYVGYHSTYGEIVTSFRGSSNIPNWIEDIDAIFTKPGVAFPSLPTVQVEAGFWDYYQSLKSCVVAAVNTLRSQHSGYKVSVTGHSLGGAGAHLFAMDMAVNMKYSGVQVYNFGSPRVGNADFASNTPKFISNFQRMTDYKDCVPAVPPTAFGYRHAVTEIYEHPAGADTYKVCSSSNGEDSTCADSLFQDDCDNHMHYMGVLCCSHP